MKRLHSKAAVALLASLLPLTTIAAAPSLDQGWDNAKQISWYETSQGSRMLPLAWVKALEQPDSTKPYLADEYWEKRLRFPMYNLSGRSLRLPRGFTVDKQSDILFKDTKLRWKQLQSSSEEWWGPTCAACHTSQIDYRGTSLTVLGGQTLGDWQVLLEDLNRTLAQTYSDPAKFDRFAKAVLGPDTLLGTGDNPQNRAMLRAAIKKIRYESKNHLYSEQETKLRYGPGRLDAVGHIYDKVTRMTEAKNPTPLRSDAPTSFPFLWNVPQLDRVQWTGFIPNAKMLGVDLGALVRNAGETIGVFADVQTYPGGVGYVASTRISNLVDIEESLGTLKPPAWPAQLFGTPKAALVAQGRQLFASNCASCHAPLARNDLHTQIKTDLTRLVAPDGGESLGTDPWTACNGYQSTSASGNLLGMPLAPGFTVSPVGLIGPKGYVLDLTAWLTIGVVLNQAPATVVRAAQSVLLGSWFGGGILPTQALLTIFKGLFALPQPVKVYSTDKQLRKKECLAIDHPLIAYKARPLNGIWATGPYLHNGSVPTLYDLLLPPQQRPKVFYTGSREFDPLLVGYVSEPNAENKFLLDTSLEGNSNAGHNYGVGKLSEAQRIALLEYLKTQ